MYTASQMLEFGLPEVEVRQYHVLLAYPQRLSFSPPPPPPPPLPSDEECVPPPVVPVGSAPSSSLCYSHLHSAAPAVSAHSPSESSPLSPSVAASASAPPSPSATPRACCAAPPLWDYADSPYSVELRWPLRAAFNASMREERLPQDPSTALPHIVPTCACLSSLFCLSYVFVRVPPVWVFFGVRLAGVLPSSKQLCCVRVGPVVCTALLGASHSHSHRIYNNYSIGTAR